MTANFESSFAHVATTSGIKVLRTPYRTPRANALCERFLGSVRRECLDHFLIFHERQLHRLRKRLCLVFQSSSTPPRAWAADSVLASALCSSLEPAGPGALVFGVGWVPS